MYLPSTPICTINSTKHLPIPKVSSHNTPPSLPTTPQPSSPPHHSHLTPSLTMKTLIRRLSRVADSSSSLRSLSPKSGVPEGHLPVYVGEEMERFVVPADLLSRPAFVELLRRSAQEYGYEQRGVLRIPCTSQFFQRVLDLLYSGSGEDFAALAEVARSLSEDFAVDVS